MDTFDAREDGGELALELGEAADDLCGPALKQQGGLLDVVSGLGIAESVKGVCGADRGFQLLLDQRQGAVPGIKRAVKRLARRGQDLLS